MIDIQEETWGSPGTDGAFPSGTKEKRPALARGPSDLAES